MNKYKIPPEKKIKLSDFDPDDLDAFKDGKEKGIEKWKMLNKKLEMLQELLYAERKQRVLIILQAMDTGGKDGVIRKVFDGVNPQGVKVISFKQPTPLELEHDFLWRIHTHVPSSGEIVIFNRSHYEDVLVVRVHKLINVKTWRERYENINHFEHLLSSEGTTIIKFYIHISYEEQRQRLLDRLTQPEKRWKFNPKDLDERKLWGDYMQAYEDAISHTSTDWAPWYIIPGNRKWYRDLIITSILVNQLEKLKMKFPEPDIDIAQYQKLLETG